MYTSDSLSLYRLCLLCLLLQLGIAPVQSQEIEPLFTLMDSNITHIHFSNQIVETPDLFAWHYDYFYNGGGVAIGDLNRDGRPDIFFAGNASQSGLYLNQGNFSFKDISQQAGINQVDKWSTGVNILDVNGDGWLDIYVCNGGPVFIESLLQNQLFLNQGLDATGIPQFKEVASVWNIAGQERSVQSVWFDIENDGDLDLFVMNNTHPSFLNKAGRNRYRPVSSRLYRNEGQGRFTDFTFQSGIEDIYYGLGLAVRDFNQDGYLDLYVANDYVIPDYYWINQGDGTFVNEIKQRLNHTSFYGMGCDAADINNDGLEDLMVLDMTPGDHVRNKQLMPSMNVALFHSLVYENQYIPQYMFNTLQLNQGKGFFGEIGLMGGVAQTDWSWSSLLADFDLDGHKDLFVTNGFYRDIKDNDWQLRVKQVMQSAKGQPSKQAVYQLFQEANSQPVPNMVFRNQGNLQFKDQTQAWGFDQPTFSHGAVYADLDLDGDLDLVINNLMSPAMVYRNNTDPQRNGRNFIRFHLSSQDSLCHALNARVFIHYQNQMQVMDNTFVRGYQSQVESIVHFGLDTTTRVDFAEIQWLDGTTTRLEQPAVNQVHRVIKPQAAETTKFEKVVPPAYFQATSIPGLSKWQHIENELDEFETEILLPHRQANFGPALAVADVNGDGLEDVYVGGARGQAGTLFMQDQSGRFRPTKIADFAQDDTCEDVDALFFDVEGDGDLDLYVCSGGDASLPSDTKWNQDRIYLNNGKGQFHRQNHTLPAAPQSTGTIAVGDWDQDGDLDLFVGGRNQAGRYPFAEPSHLLINEGGTFSDQTKIWLPEALNFGLVTSASWADIDSDGQLDLIVAGEWMPITVCFQRDGKFDPIELPNTKGWWYSIAQADFDQDGDPDFLVGNVGLNNKFHPTATKPLHIYTEDFDENGSFDIVLSKTYKGELVPVRGRECSSQQMPMIKDKFPSFEGFATAKLADIYTPEKLTEAYHLEAHRFDHIYLHNEGGNLVPKPLPQLAQLAPVLSILVTDLNGDHLPDAILAGNIMETEVETPAYDAGRGTILLNQGDEFEVLMPITATGLSLHHSLKKLAILSIDSDVFVIGANNNDGLASYRFTQRHK